MKIYTATFPSLTYAMKAQNILADARLSSKIVKLDAKITRKGCAYGIEFPGEELSKIRQLLTHAGVRPNSFLDRGGGEIL